MRAPGASRDGEDLAPEIAQAHDRKGSRAFVIFESVGFIFDFSFSFTRKSIRHSASAHGRRNRTSWQGKFGHSNVGMNFESGNLRRASAIWELFIGQSTPACELALRGQSFFEIISR